MVDVKIENVDVVNKALKALQRDLADLTIPLTLISRDFYQSEQAIFQNTGPGQYDDLSPSYKKEKEKAVGFVYPILRRTGRLMRSVTNPSDGEAINQIINKDTLVIGTRVPYGVLHQEGIGVPQRPFLFIGPESRFATDEQGGRLYRWLQIIEDYHAKVIRQNGLQD